MSGRLRSSLEADRYLTCPVCCGSASPIYQAIAAGLEIGHDGKAHRIYKTLRWQLRSAGELVRMTDEEILALKDVGPAALRRIRSRIPAPVPAQTAKAAAPPRLLQLAARHVEATFGDRHYELARAVTAVLLEAAEDYACCERVNGRHRRGALPELPNPVSEAAYTAARILLENP